MNKRRFYTELAYLLGLAALALGAALMAKANFGMSMVVAPAYLLHLHLSQSLPFFSFGMAEYILQAILLLALSLFMRKGKLLYLLALGTAVFYGLLLDGAMALLALVPQAGLPGRILFYLSGLLCCAAGVSMLFHSYLPPEAYELVVKEIAAKYGLAVHKCKTVYDCCSCLLAIVLSFSFFGPWQFVGVKLGTVLCALLNGWLIGRWSAFLEKRFVFQDKLPLQRFFA